MKRIINMCLLVATCMSLLVGCSNKVEIVGNDEEIVKLYNTKSFCNELSIHSENLGGYSRIFYYDYKSDKTVYACSQANCNHEVDTNKEKITCNAMVEGTVPVVFLYKKQLYYVVSNGAAHSSVWRCKTDGSEKEKIAEIDGYVQPIETVLAKGELYLVGNISTTKEVGEEIITMSKTQEVYKVALDSGNVEKITNFGAKADAQILYVRAFGDKVFIRYNSSEKTLEEAGFKDSEEYTNWLVSEKFSYKEQIERLGESDLTYCYDMISGKVEKLDIGFESNFSEYKGIDNMEAYYVMGYGEDVVYYLDATVGSYTLYSYNMNTDERKQLLSSYYMYSQNINGKIYIVCLEMDESTKDDNIPKVDTNIAPVYYSVNTKDGSVTEQNYGKDGKLVYVLGATENGLAAYVNDFDDNYAMFDIYNIEEINKKDIK